MITVTKTTYYPAILLRKRWHEAVAARQVTFDVAEELQCIQVGAPLTSSEISVLERWSAGRDEPAAGGGSGTPGV